MKNLKIALIFSIVLLIASLTFALLISYPFKCSLNGNLEAQIIELNSKKYIVISSKDEEQIRNPLYPIEFLDYKYSGVKQVKITKYKMFSCIPIIKKDPLLSQLPLIIPLDFFQFTKEDVEIYFWTKNGYKYLTKLSTLQEDNVK